MRRQLPRSQRQWAYASANAANDRALGTRHSACYSSPRTKYRPEAIALTTTETALNGKVQALLLDQIARGTQLGTQVSVYRNGEQIVDTWAGEMGPEDPRPVQGDSLFSSFSTTKGVAATALHILADRGIID